MQWKEQVEKVFASHFPPGSKLLVAVSGGPDSVALLHVAKALPYTLVVGHVDHQLRRSSSRDAAFVKALAGGYDLPFRAARVPVRRYAARHRGGLEEAARVLRYRKLAAMARAEGCIGVLTAHTSNDQAETVLMNFLRGAGSSGLAGIPTSRRLEKKGRLVLVRPFLTVSREQIMSYSQHYSLSFRRDPTNDSFLFARNRIRHATLPYLEKTSPGLANRLLQTANIFRQEEDFWHSLVEGEIRKMVRRKRRGKAVVLPRLLGYHRALSRRILRHVFPGLSFNDIESKLSEIQKRTQ